MINSGYDATCIFAACVKLAERHGEWSSHPWCLVRLYLDASNSVYLGFKPNTMV